MAAVNPNLAVDDPAEVHFETDSVRGGPNVIWLLTTCNRMDCSCSLLQNGPFRERCYVFWDQKRLKDGIFLVRNMGPG